jgi:HAD superfamily hydrolase (TIGR01509 family)
MEYFDEKSRWTACKSPLSSQTMRAIVFDMDGLMIDSERIYWDAGRQIAREHGKEVSDQTLGRMMGRKPLESLTVFATELGIPDRPEDLLEAREARVVSVLEAGVEPMSGLMDVLPVLRQKYKLAIATSARRYMVDIIMRSLRVEHYFDVVQTSDDVTNGKPDPEIYLKAMSKLGVKPAESVVLEDSSNGALSGKRAGAYVIAVPSQYTRHQDFGFADYIAADLTDAATHIAAIA